MSIKTQRLFERAKKNLKNGNNIEAEKAYKAILKEFPDNLEAKKGLEEIPKNSPNLSPSKAQMDSLIRLYTTAQYDEALKSSSNMINDFPDEPSLYNICGACHVAKGSLNDAIINFQNAIELISKFGQIKSVGNIYVSKPYGLKEQNNFYNTAIEILTTCQPMELMLKLQSVEKKLIKNLFLLQVLTMQCGFIEILKLMIGYYMQWIVQVPHQQEDSPEEVFFQNLELWLHR